MIIVAKVILIFLAIIYGGVASENFIKNKPDKEIWFAIAIACLTGLVGAFI